MDDKAEGFPRGMPSALCRYDNGKDDLFNPKVSGRSLRFDQRVMVRPFDFIDKKAKG